MILYSIIHLLKIGMLEVILMDILQIKEKFN